MKLLFRTLNTFQANDAPLVLRGRTDGRTLYITLRTPDDRELPSLAVTLVYNGTSKAMVRSAPEEMTASFPYSDGAKTLGLSGAAFQYHNKSVAAISWKGGASDPDPEVEVFLPGIRVEESNRIQEVKASAGTGRVLRLTEVHLFSRLPPAAEWIRRTFSYGSNFVARPFQFFTAFDMYEGWEAWYRLVYAAYPTGTDGDHDAYTGIVEVETDVVVVSGEGCPYAPANVTVSRSASGTSAEVRWVLPADTRYPAEKIELERSVNGGDFVLVTSGLTTSYTDPLPSAPESVVYRVRAVRGETTSPWVTAREAEETERSNLRIMTAGGSLTVAGLYVGVGGLPVRAKLPILVGGFSG